MKWENVNCEIERFTRALVLNGFRCGKNGAPGRDLTGPAESDSVTCVQKPRQRRDPTPVISAECP